MELKILSDNEQAIMRVVQCRELPGDVAYTMGPFSRRFKEVMTDLAAFEVGLVAELKLTYVGNSLIHPKQDMDNLKEYLDRRKAFIAAEQVKIVVPSFNFKQLESAKLSPDDINAIIDVGLLEPPEPVSEKIK